MNESSKMSITYIFRILKIQAIFYIITKYRKLPVEILVLPVPAGQPRLCPVLDVKRRAESDETGFMKLSGN